MIVEKKMVLFKAVSILLLILVKKEYYQEVSHRFFRD